MLRLIQDVAADVITPRFRALAHGEVMEKRPGDLVTVADHEAEEIITQALLDDDPHVLVVGEEATATDPTLIDRLGEADHAFLVDPIDGTKNFVGGRADHAVMVAELRAGESVRAWIWQPEHQLAYVAERGAGVYRNDERLHRQPPSSDPAALKIIASRPEFRGQHGDLTVEDSAWCCGVDYPWLAEGQVDAIMYVRGKPWDHAPGSLLATEMGGVARLADGSPYRPRGAGRDGLLVAADEPTWETVRERLDHLFRRIRPDRHVRRS